MFLGRKEELTALENLYNKDSFSVFVIYGDKGAGKTTLLREFCRNKNSIFFTASPKSNRANLNKFSVQVLNYYDDEEHESFPFWSSVFSYIKHKQDGRRLVIVLDEFSELAEKDAAFMNVFMTSIEHDLIDSNVFLILSSSNINFVESSILKKIALLPRKITAQLRINNFLTEEVMLKLRQDLAKTSRDGGPSRILKYSADDIILKEGEINKSIYKVISGRAVCYLNYGTDDEYLLGSLQENNVFGEYSLLTGKPGIYTVVAYSDMLVLRIGRDEFQKFIEMNSDNAIKIMQNMARMLNVMKYNIDMLRNELK
ncbi:MAG: cyclic nucleotide-binding domain-containing protein [Synergistaceae bacterium]|nr:cyclic nucleotide-binding domain-containing protein [Synergistaceae bacterium]